MMYKPDNHAYAPEKRKLPSRNLRRCVALFGLIMLLVSCNNNALLDRIENPGGNSSLSRAETFTSNNYIFVSSWRTAADMSSSPHSQCDSFSGVAKANCACTAAAAANNLRKSVNHEFVAVLSTDIPDMYDFRCKIQSLPSSTCGVTDLNIWLNTRDEVIATNLALLLEAANSGAPNYSEFGSPADSDIVWTGTNSFGVATASTCNNWSSTAANVFGMTGLRTGLNGSWLNGGDMRTCDTMERIYCASRL